MRADAAKESGGGVLGRRAALTLSTVFLVLLATVAATLYLDHRRGGELESVRAETAVGDFVFLPHEGGIGHHDVAVVFQGRPLYYAYLTPLEIPDTAMRRVGIDDGGRYAVYRPERSGLARGHDGQPLYYIKSEVDRYFQLQERPGGIDPPIIE